MTYQQLKKSEKALNDIPYYNSVSDNWEEFKKANPSANMYNIEFWEAHKAFKDQLNEFLRGTSIHNYSKSEIIQVLTWCNTHRPCEPFRVLHWASK